MRLDEFGEIPARPMVCRSCAIGLHHECEHPVGEDAEGFFICCCSQSLDDDPAPAAARSDGEQRTVGGQVLQPSKMKDVVSAGRKRAATLYPIHDGMVCEWSGLLFAGGGVEPITGCNGNLIFEAKAEKAHDGQDPLAGNIHHGPDKSTLSNQESNIARVCLSCHHQWHHLNNRYYTTPRPEHGAPWLPNVPYQQHDPATRASAETLEATAAGRVSANPRVADPHRRGVVPEDEWVLRSSHQPDGAPD